MANYNASSKLKKAFIYLVVIIIIALGIIFTFNLHLPHHHKKRHTLSASQQSVDAFMHGIQAENFNRAGFLEDNLKSRYISRNMETHITLLQSPYLIAREPSAPSWHIRAQHGKLSGEQQNLVYLWGAVKLDQPLINGDHNMILTTSKLKYNRVTEIGSTKQPVTIIQPDSVIHGVGMVADMKHGDIKLLHHTEAQFIANHAVKPEKTS